MKKITKTEIKKINKLRSLFPSQIIAKVHRSKSGKFCAEIITYQGCFTEADTFSGLIEMVNDAVRTYFEIPEKYLSFMPDYLPSIELAQVFSAFPVKEKTQELKFKNINAEANC
ncbi:MAG: hypothetical protein AAB361_03400 [Patescibacteria group bacterium]